MQMFRRPKAKHISWCIKNIRKLNTCDLEKSKITNIDTIHINSLENVHVIEMSSNEKFRKNKMGMLHNSHN